MIILGLVSLCGASVWALDVFEWLKDSETTSPRVPSPDKETKARGVSESDNVIPLPVEPSQEVVMFNWNGHLWEAHEVLGVELGCTLEVAEKAYEDGCEIVDPHSRAFLRMAFRSLGERKKSLERAGQRNK